MLQFKRIAGTVRQPQGLAARAVLFTALVVTITAAFSAGIVLWGAQREGVRQELAVTRDLTEYLASRAGDVMENGPPQVLIYMLHGATRQPHVRSVSIRGVDGRVLAQEGGDAADNAVMARLTGAVLASGAQHNERTANGGLAVAAPIVKQGRLLGVAVRMWEHGAYRFDALPALAPFLLILIALMLAAIPLTAYVVRRAISPLDVLTQFASRVATEGQAPPISLKTGDEFETLADAFNASEGKVEVRVLGPLKVEVTFPTTLANLDRLFDGVPMLSSRSALKERAGAGPFVVAEHKPGSHLLLKRNPQYWKTEASSGRRLPYLDAVRIEIQQNSDLEYMRFRKGELHMVPSMTADNFERLGKESPASITDAGPSLESELLWFNQVSAAPIPAWKREWFRSRDAGPSARRHAQS